MEDDSDYEAHANPDLESKEEVTKMKTRGKDMNQCTYKEKILNDEFSLLDEMSDVFPEDEMDEVNFQSHSESEDDNQVSVEEGENSRYTLIQIPMDEE